MYDHQYYLLIANCLLLLPISLLPSVLLPISLLPSVLLPLFDCIATLLFRFHSSQDYTHFTFHVDPLLVRLGALFVFIHYLHCWALVNFQIDTYARLTTLQFSNLFFDFGVKLIYTTQSWVSQPWTCANKNFRKLSKTLGGVARLAINTNSNKRYVEQKTQFKTLIRR